MHTMYIPSIGEVTLHLNTIYVERALLYITGYDCKHNRIKFAMDKFRCLDDYPCDCGYCHVVSYTKDGVTTQCNFYKSLS